MCVQELLRRWEQYAVDHQSYDDQLSTCREWQRDLADRLSTCAAVEGDKFALQSKLAKTQVTMATKGGESQVTMTTQGGKNTGNYGNQRWRNTGNYDYPGWQNHR